MRLDKIEKGAGSRHLDIAFVTLSRRNLLTLLAFIEDRRFVPEINIQRDGYWLNVAVEDDEMHYGKRDVGAGPMPGAESFIAELEGFLEARRSRLTPSNITECPAGTVPKE